ncbi:hypothetical protein K440DRAFT_639395 [Wilcoxina mikolae CBS 423.85]|nr:hypothetical protein K440DRAFT_639395 [Wilcoxina mikolae CBS 423.85]
MSHKPPSPKAQGMGRGPLTRPHNTNRNGPPQPIVPPHLIQSIRQAGRYQSAVPPPSRYRRPPPLHNHPPIYNPPPLHNPPPLLLLPLSYTQSPSHNPAESHTAFIHSQMDRNLQDQIEQFPLPPSDQQHPSAAAPQGYMPYTPPQHRMGPHQQESSTAGFVHPAWRPRRPSPSLVPAPMEHQLHVYQPYHPHSQGHSAYMHPGAQAGPQHPQAGFVPPQDPVEQHPVSVPSLDHQYPAAYQHRASNVTLSQTLPIGPDAIKSQFHPYYAQSLYSAQQQQYLQQQQAGMPPGWAPQPLGGLPSPKMDYRNRSYTLPNTMTIISPEGKPEEVPVEFRPVEAVNPDIALGITEHMPEGYWCGRFSTLRDRMLMENPQLSSQEREDVVLRRLQASCASEEALASFRDFAKKVTVQQARERVLEGRRD